MSVVIDGITYVPYHRESTEPILYDVAGACSILVVTGFMLWAFVAWYQGRVARRYVQGEKDRKVREAKADLAAAIARGDHEAANNLSGLVAKLEVLAG